MRASGQGPGNLRRGEGGGAVLFRRRSCVAEEIPHLFWFCGDALRKSILAVWPTPFEILPRGSLFRDSLCLS